MAEAEEPVLTANALTANALTANALYPNALTANALTANALTAGAISPGALAAIRDPGPAGVLSRQLLQYTVSCALAPSQGFSFSWTDSQHVVHPESYPGALGIEPGWATAPLTPPGQRMVTGCLLSRVNYYGTPVGISERSMYTPLLTTAGSAELAAYPHVEGAFWGNLFTPTPWAYACYDAANAANSRQRLRECAVGHLNPDGTTASCGIIQRLGDCAALGASLTDQGQYYLSCPNVPGATDKTTSYVVTTALP